MKSLDQINVTLAEFFARNSQINKGQLADLLGVSSGVITRMDKQGMTRIQSLALEALDKRIAKENMIELDITEWFDKTYGNSYFSGYVYFQGKRHFLPMQYGYGSHCEDMAIKLLEEVDIIPKGFRQYELKTKFNIGVKTNRSEVRRKKDLYDGSEFKLGAM